jgi:hypothetical protein
MVSAINAGLQQRLFSLLPGDNRWLGFDAANNRNQYQGHVFRFVIDNIPAIGSVTDAGFDELSIHVAFWPTPDGERWVKSSNAFFLAGELFAYGWLERRDGAWLQTASKPGLSCRKPRLAVAAGVDVRPRGYADRGNFKL